MTEAVTATIKLLHRLPQIAVVPDILEPLGGEPLQREGHNGRIVEGEQRQQDDRPVQEDQEQDCVKFQARDLHFGPFR